jgi:hypothetical protein
LKKMPPKTLLKLLKIYEKVAPMKLAIIRFDKIEFARVMRLEVVCVENLCGRERERRTTKSPHTRGILGNGGAPPQGDGAMWASRPTNFHKTKNRPNPFQKRIDMRPQASKQALRLVCVNEEFEVDKR